MSIRERLNLAVEQGHLVRYQRASVEGFRQLYLTAALYDELQNEQSAIAFFGQRSAVSAFFTRWLNGSRLSLRIEERTGRNEMARLEPPPEEIWEMRITEPRPQLRIFGRFVDRNVFVAMFAVNRDRLGNAFSTPGRKSQSWLGAMYDCETLWNGIFGGAEPFRGATHGDYVSENPRQSRKSL